MKDIAGLVLYVTYVLHDLAGMPKMIVPNAIHMREKGDPLAGET